MAFALLAFVFSLSYYTFGSVSSDTVAGTQTPGENIPSLSGNLDVWRDEGGTGGEMPAQTILRSSALPVAASSPSLSKPERPLSSSSSPSVPSPSLDPVTNHQISPEPSSVTEELIDGLTVRERAFRIAMLRRQLQEKLGLTGLPLPSPDKPYRSLPQAIKKRLIGNQPPQRDLPMYEQPDSEITEVLSYAENDTTNCPGPGLCFLFHLVRDILGKQIKSIHLWMYLTPSADVNRSSVRRLTVWLLRIGESGIVRKELATKIVSKREGWFHLELPQEKHDWDSLEHRLQLTNAAVDFSTDPSPSEEPSRLPPISMARDELPILTVAVDVDKRHRRLRRQSQNICQLNTDTCCLHPFQVDMADVLGGVVALPVAIDANFCRGSCFLVTNFETVHAKVMRDRALIETDEDLKEELVPCCVPVTYASEQSMFIRQANGTLVRREVAEISAMQCSCK